MVTRTPSNSPFTQLVTGVAADGHLDRITGVQSCRKKIFVPALNAARHGFATPGRLAPPSAPGIRFWADGTEELRIRFEEFGGRVPVDAALNSAGVVLTADGTRGVAIVSGSEATDLAGYSPQVRYARGRVAVDNAPSLFDTGDEPVERLELWYLLHRVTSDSWRAELSLPAGIGKAGWVTGWRARIHIASDDQDSDETAPVASTPELPSPTVRWRESA